LALRQYQLDGLILCAANSGLQARRRLFGRQPVSRSAAGEAPSGVWQVRFDERQGLAKVVRLLAGLGAPANRVHRGRLAVPPARADLLRTILRQGGLPERRAWWFQAPACGSEAACVGLKRVLRPRARALPTALIAGDDVMAQAALRACTREPSACPRTCR